MGDNDTIDPDFVGNVNITQAEMHDYVVLSYDGYFAKKENSNNGSSSQNDDDEAMEEIFTKDPSSHGGYIRFLHVENILVTLGNGHVPQGLELAIRFLSRGQCAIVCCHSKYAHPHGRKNTCIMNSVAGEIHQKDQRGLVDGYDLPPSTNVIYRVCLKSIKSSSDYQSYEFRLKLANQLKRIGNDYFTNEWMGPNGGFGKAKALKAYNNATQELISLLNDCQEAQAIIDKNVHDGKKMMKDQIEALLVDCFNNISAVFLRDKEYVKAKEAAAQALQIDANNLKALMRAAKASLLSCSFEECYAALEAAMEVKNDDAEVLKLRAEYEWRLKEYQKKEKAMYARMMSKKKIHGSDSTVGMDVSDDSNKTSTVATSRTCIEDENPINRTPKASHEFDHVLNGSTSSQKDDGSMAETGRYVCPNWFFGMIGILFFLMSSFSSSKTFAYLDMRMPTEEL